MSTFFIDVWENITLMLMFKNVQNSQIYLDALNHTCTTRTSSASGYMSEKR